MTTQKFDKLLNKNLKRSTPDILDKIIEENQYRLNSAAKPSPRYNRRFITAAAGVCCAVFIFVSAYAAKDLIPFGSSGHNSPGITTPKDNPGVVPGPNSGDPIVDPGAGGRSGDSYPYGTFAINCEIPSNKTLAQYKLEGNGSSISFTEVLPSLFGFEITGSDEQQVNFTTDNNHVILLGDVETGLFSYQNNRNNDEDLARYANDPSVKDKTYQTAMEIVKSLQPITGEVKLKHSEVEKIDVAAAGGAYKKVSYLYKFEPAPARTVDGFADGSELIIVFDADGFVFSIVNQISSAARNHDFQIDLFDVNDYFKNHVTYEVKDAKVVLNKWDIYYVATPCFDGTSELIPVVSYEYTVNGQKISGGMTLKTSLD